MVASEVGAIDAKIGEVMKYLLSTVFSILFVVSAAASAQQAGNQTQQLEQINELLKQNPEVIPSVLNSLQQYIASKKNGRAGAA